MLDVSTLYADLEEAGLGDWREALESMLPARLDDKAHGKLANWRAAVDALPAAVDPRVALDRGAVSVRDDGLNDAAAGDLRELLLALSPWRKGPFRINDILIDSEWRSDLKWRRFADAIAPLDDRLVLDVGSGNGYYALRMLGAGARCVVGIDPSLLFVCQFAALQKMMALRRAHVLPLRLEELPPAAQRFDTTFSMGVLYHRREPLEHLAQLRDTLRSGGQLVLETLIFPGRDSAVIVPEDRYARMRNVWHLPTIPALVAWLEETGFRAIDVIDVTETTVEEQRTTEWMTFESLREALNPRDRLQTIEELPAPTRAVVLCEAP